MDKSVISRIGLLQKTGTTCASPRRGQKLPVSGLSLTPVDAERLASSGVPINDAYAQTADFVKGVVSGDWTVAPENRRYADLGTLWEGQVSASRRIRGILKHPKNK